MSSASTQEASIHEAFLPSPDTDVAISSSDGVLFYLNKQRLELGSGVFPPAHFASDEVVKLSEQAETLAILFQFLLPRRHPQLDREPFELVRAVAEAAEKYAIYNAMAVASLQMRRFVITHPQDVLRYSVIHGYHTTMDLAAPLFCRRPLTDLIEVLPSKGFLAAWIQYHLLSQSVFERVETVLNCPTIPNAMAMTPKARTSFDPFIYPKGAEAGVQFSISGAWRPVCAGAGFALHQHLATLRAITDYNALLAKLDELPGKAHPIPSCGHMCEYTACLAWMADTIGKGIKALPPFSTLAPISDVES